MKMIREYILAVTIGVALIYVCIAAITFECRHPWATDTEKLIYSIEMITFQKVPYKQMRPRE